MEYTLWMHCEEIVKMSWLCLPLSHIRFLQPSPDLLGEVVFLPLYLWDTLTENLEMQSCPFSFHHYGEISSVPSVFLKLKPVFFQRQRNCTEFSRCLKTLAEIYWFKNLTKKKEESHVSEDGKCLSIVNEQFNRADFFQFVLKNC